MKKLMLIAVLATFAGVARAEWSDLKVGMDGPAALRCVGAPLLQMNKGRGGAANWTYDFGACIQFQYGRVVFWTAPKPPKQIPHASSSSAVVKAPAAETRSPTTKPAA